MIKYAEVLHDKSLELLYKEIDVKDEKPWALHGLTHILNVVKTMEEVLTQLKVDKETIELAKIAGFLHDTGIQFGKENHAHNSKIFAYEYLKDKNITEVQLNRILNAIENHGGKNSPNDIIEAVLVFADKLDVDKTRLGSGGYQVDGLNQLQFVDRIEYSMLDRFLSVNFICNPNFDKSKFENFYFCEKIFNAINNFANFINKESNININGEKWEINKSKH